MSVTEEDKQKFPELFVTKRQIVVEEKNNIGKTMRNKLKKIKQANIEARVMREKEIIKQRWRFEELLQKYERFRRPGDELPPHLNRNGRQSVI